VVQYNDESCANKLGIHVEIATYNVIEFISELEIKTQLVLLKAAYRQLIELIHQILQISLGLVKGGGIRSKVQRIARQQTEM